VNESPACNVPALVSNGLELREIEMIEATLRDCKGFGAAAKLGLSSSTLESKIKSLGIDKLRFKIQRSR
jgi:DNA-binding NtrC family response regulator